MPSPAIVPIGHVCILRPIHIAFRHPDLARFRILNNAIDSPQIAIKDRGIQRGPSDVRQSSPRFRERNEEVDGEGAGVPVTTDALLQCMVEISGIHSPFSDIEAALHPVIDHEV